MSAAGERFSPEWWQDIQNRHGQDRERAGTREYAGEYEGAASSEASAAPGNRFTDHGQVAPPGSGLET